MISVLRVCVSPRLGSLQLHWKELELLSKVLKFFLFPKYQSLNVPAFFFFLIGVALYFSLLSLAQPDDLSPGHTNRHSTNGSAPGDLFTQSASFEHWF